MGKEKLFFVAIIPPPDIYQLVEGFKREAAALFQTKHALKSPAHITLVPPFRMLDDKMDDLKKALDNCASRIQPFQIHLNGFAGFPKRVVYADLVRSEALQAAYQQLKRALFDVQIKGPRWYSQFNPHMTIAFKDLKSELFSHALEHFQSKKLDQCYMQNKMTLLVHEDGKWNIHSEYPFGEN